MEFATFVALLSAAASVVALGLAALIARSSASRAQGRSLALLVGLEGVLQALAAASAFLPDEGALSDAVFMTLLLLVAVLVWLYLRLLSNLQTPLVRPLRRPWVLRGVGAFAGGLALTPIFVTWWALLAGVDGEAIFDAPLASAPIFGIFFLMMLVSAYGLVVAVSAWRRAPRGTPARAQAGAFAAAFVTRDALLVGGLVVSEFIAEGTRYEPLLEALADLSFPLMTLLYVPILAYGILRTQLFDLDLRVKWTIQRSTVATVFLVVFFVVAKVAEFYLNKTFGYVLGGVAAGLLLFLAPRVNKLGDKVANTAMPTVQPTSAYLASKKVEVYRAAVEGMLEAGSVGEKERAVLERMRAKLGLPEADARAIEDEVVGAHPHAA